MIPLQPIDGSRQVAAAGYDPTSQTLAVRFTNGSVYQYKGVTQADADGLRTAQSAGRYLQQTIKPAYDFERIAPEDTEGGDAE